MSTGYGSPGSTPLLGWTGQPAIPFPKTGLFVSPGAGLVGRTNQSLQQLYLDGAVSGMMRSLSLFAPGAVSAKQVGFARSLSPSGLSTLALLACNLITAPTAGDGANFWRVKLTDSRSNTFVCPISAAGVSYYDLNTFNGVQLVAPGPYAGGTGVNFSNNGGDVGQVHSIVPTQNMIIGGATYHGVIQRSDTSAVIVGSRVRCTLTDSAGNTLGIGIVYTTGSVDGGGFETWQFAFAEQVQLVSGSTYYLAFDILLDFTYFSNNQNFRTKLLSGGLSSTSGNTFPATIDGVASGGSVGANLQRSITVLGAANMIGQLPAIQAMTIEAMLKGTTGLPNTIISNQGTPQPLFEFAPAGQAPAAGPAQVGAGGWSMNGTSSGGGNVFGNVTVAIDSVGAPAAGAAGSDLNVNVLLLPA